MYATTQGWISTLPDEYKNVTFDSCTDLPPALVEFGRNWAKEWPLKSLYLYGVWGSGKTTFAYAAIHEVLKNLEGKGYFWPYQMSAKKLDNELLRAVKSDDGDEAIIKKTVEHQLLFIDDIDKVNPTERFKNQLFEIINQRTIIRAPTIITSNCVPSEIAQILDGAVISRMADQTKWQTIQFPKKDLRKIKPLVFS